MNKRRLSKGDLCRILGYYSPRSGLCYYQNLKKDLVTPEFLKALNIQECQYNEIRVFTPQQSLTIIEFLKITEDELQEI